MLDPNARIAGQEEGGHSVVQAVAGRPHDLIGLRGAEGKTGRGGTWQAGRMVQAAGQGKRNGREGAPANEAAGRGQRAQQGLQGTRRQWQPRLRTKGDRGQ